MPDPEPQPTQPRAISTARWLLMLTLSVIAIAAPLIADVWLSAHLLPTDDPVGTLLWMLIFTLLIPVFAIGLSFGLGYRLDKWRGDSPQHSLRPIGYGFAILIVNCIIAFAGCIVIFHP
jgi:hypothetical protein